MRITFWQSKLITPCDIFSLRICTSRSNISCNMTLAPTNVHSCNITLISLIKCTQRIKESHTQKQTLSLSLTVDWRRAQSMAWLWPCTSLVKFCFLQQQLEQRQRTSAHILPSKPHPTALVSTEQADLLRVNTVVKLCDKFKQSAGESRTLGNRWEILLEQFMLAVRSAKLTHPVTLKNVFLS